MKFRPVQCLSGKIDAEGRQEEMHYDMAACAEMSQQYEAVPATLAEAMDAGDGAGRRDTLFDPDNKMLWYETSVGSGAGLRVLERSRIREIRVRVPRYGPLPRFRPPGRWAGAVRAAPRSLRARRPTRSPGGPRHRDRRGGPNRGNPSAAPGSAS